MKLSVESEMRRARSHAKKGEDAQAAEIYGAVLKAFPKNKRAQQELAKLNVGPVQRRLPDDEYNRLVGRFKQGTFADVVRDGERLAFDYPDDFILQFVLGAANASLQRHDAAIANYRRGLSLNPDYADGHFNLANVLEEKGALDEAVASFERVLELKPDHARAHYNLGVVLQNLGASDKATTHYRQALSLMPDYAEAHNNLGAMLQAGGDLFNAQTHFARAIEIKPGYAEAHNNLGGTFQRLGALDDALASFARAFECQPDYAEAHYNHASALRTRGDLGEAAAGFARALEVRPDYADAHNGLGVILKEQGALEDAISRFSRVLEIDPGHAEAHNNLGVALEEKGSSDESATHYIRAVEINPDYADAHNNLGLALQNSEAIDESVASYEKALAINPEHGVARTLKLHQQAHMCDWAAMREDAALVPKLGVEGDSVPPFAMLVMDDDPGRNMLRAERHALEKYDRHARPAIPRPKDRPERLRIGYFSADFHTHATMHLMARLFAVHDREHFEIYAYSFGPDTQDAMRKRVVDTVDSFRDVRDATDEAVALQAREDAIDIAVDLKGYTQDSRPGIFAFRAAPIQVSYLGYPGTLGAPFMDYIVADDMVIPQAQRHNYSEKMITLPHSYQINDDTRIISERSMNRAEFGLPEDAFVFCCFNSNYKITPDVFDIWARLLDRVEGSVLWLLKSNEWAEDRLRAEAADRNIDGERIVFAERVGQSEHLARCRLADLFLDTFACNAHTTASDALWAGLPLITRPGQGFPARVAGSLLKAVGLPDLIAETDAEYETLACELAGDPDRLRAIRRTLADNRTAQPLFNTELTARHLEDAYRHAYQLYFDGEVPANITIQSDTQCAVPERAVEEPSPDIADERSRAATLREKAGNLLRLYNQGRLTEAADDAEGLVRDHPENFVLHNFLGVVRAALNQPDRALVHYRRALEIKPDHAEAHYNLGLAQQKQGDPEAAAASYGRAIEIKPTYADAHYNLGLARQKMGQLDEAVGCFARVLEIEPGYDKAREQKFHQLAHMCDWTALREAEGLIPKLGIEGASVSPFSMLAMEDDPARHLVRSQRAAADNFTGKPLSAAARPQERLQERPDRLRIGYFSADFHNHATMYLMARLFELHDRSEFEVHAYSYGADKQDEMRKRLVDNVDVFRDVREVSDEAAARLAHEDALDIAIDLKGFTKESRAGIFAYRPAPVQISYLGYPGTLGAPFMDYIIGDETVIPQNLEQHYSEKVIRLPHCYQVNDDTRPISDRAMARSDFGLPENGFVFCCFNSSYKIGPGEFDVWMRLLGRVENSVLWLLKTNTWAEANLRRQAEDRGVDGRRIVFAERLPLDEHLARYRLADLFLDTFAYNAHTTGSDALWAGLPLVTKLGQGFATRVGGSLLNAVGLPELITQTHDAYEALALELAENPERLAEVKDKLAQNRSAAPLFDTAGFVRHIEDAYRQVYQIHFNENEPETFAIGASTGPG